MNYLFRIHEIHTSSIMEIKWTQRQSDRSAMHLPLVLELVLNFCLFIKTFYTFSQGCGRKRSNEVAPPVPIQSNFEDEEGISDILELNAEPAIENLMRQILSEAKMYEAIQEANREMFLQKLKHASNSNRAPSANAYSMQ